MIHSKSQSYSLPPSGRASRSPTFLRRTPGLESWSLAVTLAGSANAQGAGRLEEPGAP